LHSLKSLIVERQPVDQRRGHPVGPSLGDIDGIRGFQLLSGSGQRLGEQRERVVLGGGRQLTGHGRRRAGLAAHLCHGRLS
jgi:hypothetical protein